MTIIGIAGAIGSGKSHTQLKTGLEHANRKERQLVTNFPLDLVALQKYCKLKKYHWLLNCISRGTITWMSSPKSLQALFLPESVVLLDEAGIFLNSREFAKTPKELLADLAQSRKFGCDLIYCAQFDDQVDRQMRLLTQYWVHCDSLSGYDKALRRPCLLYKRIYTFKACDYQNWQTNPKDRSSHFKARFAYSTAYEGGILDKSDKLLFDCFDSFDRLDFVKPGRDNDHIITSHRSILPPDYYYNTACV